MISKEDRQGDLPDTPPSRQCPLEVAYSVDSTVHRLLSDRMLSYSLLYYPPPPLQYIFLASEGVGRALLFNDTFTGL